MTKFKRRKNHGRNPYNLQHASYSEASSFLRNLPIQLLKSFCSNGANYHLKKLLQVTPVRKTNLEVTNSAHLGQTNHTWHFSTNNLHCFLRSLCLRNRVWCDQSAGSNWWTLAIFGCLKWWILNFLLFEESYSLICWECGTITYCLFKKSSS